MADDDLRTRLFDLDVGGFDADIGFYESLARRTVGEGGAALELGVGTGRVAIPLARAGFEVWGIDADEALLSFARRAAGDGLERLRLQRGDMRDFDLGRAFDLIYAAYGTFHHLLTDGEQRDCLACVQAHLAPGGCFAFDLRPWSFADWEEAETAVLFHDWTRALPGGETVLKLRSALPDAERRLQRETHIYDVISPSGEVRRLVVPVDLRFSSRYEIERLLQEAGLALDQVYGDFDLGPFDELSSDYLITVASRPEDREQP